MYYIQTKSAYGIGAASDVTVSRGGDILRI
jgi:hypothetical protein